MEKTLLILVATLSTLIGFSQNLIPNPSFELYSSLPNDLGQFALCDQWTNCSSSDSDPDFYHTNASLLSDLPVTSVAEVFPHSGNALMGFVAAGKSGSNYREYLSVKLSSPTIPGRKYNVSFNITNGEVYNYSLSGLGVSQLGVCLSNTQLIQISNEPINATPYFESFEVMYNRGWEKVSFSFIANSSLEWLTLGVFNDDSDLDIQFMDGNSSLADYAYYFVDNFSMENITLELLQAEDDRNIARDIEPEADSEFPFFVPNAFTPDGNGNNDTFSIIVGQKNIDFTISVFDRWGKQIYYAENGNPEWDGKCSGKSCPNGIYVWRVKYSQKDKEGNDVFAEETGTIHLIR